MRKTQRAKTNGKNSEQTAEAANTPPAAVAESEVDKAREILQKQIQERVQTCQRDLDALLKKHKCRLDFAMILSKDGIQPLPRIVPTE